MRHIAISAAALATASLLLAATSLQAATLISIDMGSSNAQAGFETFLLPQQDGNTGLVTRTYSVGDLLSVPTGTLGVTLVAGNNAVDLSANTTTSMNQRDRVTNPADTANFTYNGLLRDRIVAVGGTAGTGLFLQLTGLQPNTAFVLQTWGYDNAKAGTNTLYDRTLGQDQALGSYTAGANVQPANNNSFSITATVTSDANGRVLVQSRSGIDGSGIMNGFVLSTIPEPGTGSLLALSGGALLARRRRK
jgi:hypothetical protein